MDDAGSSIFDKELERIECVLNSLPFFGLAAELLPELLHDESALFAKEGLIVCLLRVCVLGQDLQPLVLDVPDSIASGIRYDLFEFGLLFHRSSARSECLLTSL